MSSSTTVARNSFWSGLDMLVTLITALVCSIAVARVMGPVKLGHYNYIIWIANMMSLVMVFGIPSATRKYVAEMVGRGEVATGLAIAQRMMQYQLIMAGLTAVLGLGAVHWLLPGEEKVYTALAVLSLFPAMVLAICTHVLLAFEDVQSTVIPSFIATVVNFSLVLLTLWLGWDLVGLAAALLVSRSTDCAVRWWLYRRRVLAEMGGHWPEAQLPVELRPRILRFCIESTLLLVINVVVWNRSEFLFLKHFCPIQEVSFFSLGFNLLERLQAIPEVFARAVGVTLMVQVGRNPESLQRFTVQSLRYLALLALPLALGMAALASPLIQSFYGAAYKAAIVPTTIQAVLLIPKMLLLPAQMLLVATERQGFLWRWGLVCGVLNVGLDWWWIPGGGAVGASWANGLTQAVAALGIWVVAARAFQMEMPWKGLAKIAAAAMSSAVMAALCSWLLPGWAALATGPLLGAVAFVLVLMQSRALDEVDHERLMKVSRLVPGRLRGVYAGLVGRLATAPAR